MLHVLHFITLNLHNKTTHYHVRQGVPKSARGKDVWQPFRVEVRDKWIQEYDEALSLLAEPRVADAVKVLGNDPFLPTQVITTLGKAAQWMLAIAFFSEMAGRWQAALAVLSAAPALAVRPNEFTYNSAISACEKGRRWTEALAIFAALPVAKIAANVITYGAAMSACEKAAQWQKALFLLASMEGATVAKNNIAFCNAFQWQSALQLFWQMPEQGVSQDDVSFSATISACEKGGQWETALSLLNRMPQVRISPSIPTISAAVTACEGMSQWEMALHLFFKSEGVDGVDGILMNSAISAAEKGGRWDVALQLLGEFEERQLKKTEITYTAAISACESSSKWEAALAVFVEMIRDLPGYSDHGIQVGSVLSCFQQVHGRPRTMEMLEDFRQRFFSGTSGTIYGDQTDLCNPTELRRLEILVDSYKVLATAPGVLAIEKPAGTETHEAIQILSQELQRTVTFVSRLDQTTSGIVPVVLGDDTSVAANWLRAQWAARLVDKEYICLCAGEFDVDRGEVTGNLRLSAENSMLMEVLASYPSPGGKATKLSLLRVQPHTGRKHQIRIHLASIGRPLLGDKRYWPGTPDWCPRLFLHCRGLKFLDLRGKPLEIECPLPPELLDVLQMLSGEKDGRMESLKDFLFRVATYDQFKAIYGKFGVKGSANVVASSFTAGLVYSIITMPFESAKNRMASQKPDPETGKLPYRGTLQTIQTVAGKEGATALYNGFFPYFLRCGGHTVLMFFAVEELQKLYRKSA
eukprot:symbB.v1.2.017798.t1/scaffold1394.1/size200789/21